jgi:glycine oxidase
MVKVVIGGGGALGSAAALVLAQAGAEVVVVDAPKAAPNASAVAAGMLAPALEAVFDPAAAPHVDLLRRARTAWSDFARRAGLDLDERGAWVAGSQAFVAKVRGRLDELGFTVGSKGLEAARAQYPGLAKDVEAALFTPGEAVVEPVAALQAIRRASERAGARWLEATVRGRGPNGVETDLGTHACDRLILATGGALIGWAPATAALVPIKGHILRIDTGARGGPVLRGEGVYMAPAADGLRIGATMEVGERDLSVSAERVEALKAAAIALTPSLAGAEVTVRTGLRAATPDGLPWVGPGRDEGLLLALGARRNGWPLAPLIAEVLCAYVMDTPLPAWAAALSPERAG